MSFSRLVANQAARPAVADGAFINARGTRSGEVFTAPWKLALVMEGKCFMASPTSATTPIAGHSAIDADQPEFAIRAAADTLVVLPLYLLAGTESGATTLGVHELMWAISNIDVANGTSTGITPMNCNLSSSDAATAVVRHTYSANGTDPLTAGNYTELVRSSGLIDSDAATSGFTLPNALWVLEYCPVILARTGSIVGYAGGSTGAFFSFSAFWAEFTQAEIE